MASIPVTSAAAPVAFIGVHKLFHGRPALAGATFEVESGNTALVLGANGSGKTTLLRLALGLLSPDHGEVRVFGRPPCASSRAMIGFVPGSTSYPYEWMSIREIVSLHRRYFPQWDDSWMRRVTERLEVDLDRTFASLSQGERRRAQLLCALSHRARLLVLDEPFAAVDPAARTECRELLLLYLNQIEGSSVLMTSHDADDVAVLASTVISLRHGVVERLQRVPQSEAHTRRNLLAEALAPWSRDVT